MTVRVDGGDPLDLPAVAATAAIPQPTPPTPRSDLSGGDTVAVPLGWVAGARSGDKGGNANVGVWIPHPVEGEAVGLAVGAIDSLIAPEVTTASRRRPAVGHRGTARCRP